MSDYEKEKVDVDGRLIGAHMSAAGGAYRAFARGEEIGCTAIQIFTKNQNRWAAKPLGDDEIERFHSERERTGILAIAHAAYLPNLASPDSALRAKSIAAIAEEMARCDLLGIPFLVFHPGSYTSGSRQGGIDLVADAIHEIYSEGDYRVALTIEIIAGQGTGLGSTFEELSEIVDKSGVPERLRICFDTCHAWAAGYDIKTHEGYKKVWHDFDAMIGMDKLAALHLNDSKHPLGSHRDRHEHIGKGFIGDEGFRNIMNDKRLRNIPMVLETPKGLNTRDGSDVKMDRVNIERLMGLVGG